MTSTYYLIVTDAQEPAATLDRAIDARTARLYRSAGDARLMAAGVDEALNPDVVAVDCTIREREDMA